MKTNGRTAVVFGCLSESVTGRQLPAHPDWQLLDTPSGTQGVDLVLSRDREIRVGIWLYSPESANDDLASFAALRASHPLVQWLAILPPGALEDKSLAMLVAQYFADYLTTPIDRDRLYAAVGHAEGMSRLLERATDMTESLPGDQHMVGASEAMRGVFRLIRKVAGSDAPVFISGETGTGKELTAQAIHERSKRCSGPFVAVDCGAIPPSLIHSELFGHEKGAFTGAALRKAGRIEEAEGGTLFLDEIGDMPLDLQGNFLRFLQHSTIQRVGSTKPIRINARVIAATHVDLEEAVTQGRFREDLFYRLNVLRIQMPALCERAEDIEILARYFLAQFAKDAGRSIRGYTSHALKRMRQHMWPGNIRELINRVRQATVLADGQWITPEDLGLAHSSANGETPVLHLDAAREAAERAAVRKAIKLSSSNYSAAARMLGVSRPTLYRLLEKHRAES
jgi:DNA-binding NtrC family response regulator